MTSRAPRSLPVGRAWRRRSLAAVLLAVALAAAACEPGSGAVGPTPADFTSIAAAFSQQGLSIDHVVSGETGCQDPTLTPTAISFDAKGADQTTPVRVHLYIFADGSVYTRLRSEVDACARSYIRDPATYATVDTSPYVAAGVGPWGSEFKTKLRAALQHAVSPDNVGI